MKLALTTSRKIWLSVAILLIGYSISMTFGMILGRKNQLQVQRVANDWYPAANQGQHAANYFNGQIDLYNDAISLQDPEMLVLAASEAQKVQESLQIILNAESFEADELNAVVALQNDLQDFSNKAHTVYGDAIRALTEEGSLDRAALQTALLEVAQQSEELHDRLQLKARHFSNQLHNELLDVSRDLKREQYLNAAVFLVVTVVALTCIRIILIRSAQEILDRDDALNKVVSGEVELGETFFQLNSISAKIVEEAKGAVERSAASSQLSQRMTEHAENMNASMLKLTANIRDLSGKAGCFLEQLPTLARSARGASECADSIGRDLKEIRNLSLILAELGSQLREVSDSPEFPHARSVQQSAIRVGEFAEAILKRLSAIRRAVKGDVEAASTVKTQAKELHKLGKTMKSMLDNQILETHHITLLNEALEQENGNLGKSLAAIGKQTGQISEEGELVQNEAQKLLTMMTQLHESVKSAKFKQQILHEHHLSSSTKG